MKVTSGQPGRAQVYHRPDLTPTARGRLYGRALLALTEPVVAGTPAAVTVTVILGETPLPAGGRLRMAWRWPFDWAQLQRDDPAGENTLQVETDRAGVRLAAVHRQRGDFDPWNHQIDVTVEAGNLQMGDQIRLHCGDRREGGRGWRAPSCASPAAAFLLALDPDGSERWYQLQDPAPFTIHPGPPARLLALLPSQAVAGEPIPLTVRGEDRWGNPTALPQGVPQVSLASVPWSSPGPLPALSQPEPLSVATGARVCRWWLTDAPPGVYIASARLPGTDLTTRSNLLQVLAEPPRLRHYWGDLHAGQPDVGCGAGSLDEHFAFARDVAGLQFASQQANDHYITGEEWAAIRQISATHNEPGRFVAFLGCEWSPPTADGGDRNVIYRQDEARLRRSGRFFREEQPDPEPDLTHAAAFHAALAHEPVLINMHVGGRPTNLDHHLPAIEPLAEIHSTHGTSEWFVFDALSRGYQVGITAGSDGVMGRPGADHPGPRLCRNVRSGLTAVYAAALTPDALWEAFQARRCYATSGERILLEFDVDGHPMGAAYQASTPPQIRIAATGTGPIEQVDLLRGTELLHSWQIAPAQPPAHGHIRLLWSGTQAQGTAAAQKVIWDGSLSVSGGAIVHARPIGFQSPTDSLQVEAHSVHWRSATAGNDAGLELQLAGSPVTECQIRTAPLDAVFTLGQVSQKPLVLDAGGASRQITIGPTPRHDGPHQVALTFVDNAPRPGRWPYWVRVTQVDRARAWSSPVYVGW